ncbi:Os12g0261300, partial [Oryza sativa Japonica Group]
NEKLTYFRKSFFGLVGTISAMLVKVEKGSFCRMEGVRLMLARVLLVLQLVVLVVILSPLAVFYLFGLLITAGLSLWRLLQRDYGAGEEAANLAPALNVLYSLALVQGALFFYYFTSRLLGRRLANLVAGVYSFGGEGEEEDDGGRTSVVEYMRQTRNGCEKDPSSVRGRNLVTFAVTMMKESSSSSLSSGDYSSGARILDKLLSQAWLREQHELIRQLVGSSTDLMDKLLQTLRCTGTRDRGVREHAARIVAHLAGEITLARFPQGIRCIYSLLTTPRNQQQDDDNDDDDDDSAQSSDHYKKLMVQGLVILHKLAAAEHNRRIIINSTQGRQLLSMAMAPVSADLLHRIDHEAWNDIVACSLQLMCRLVTAPGETGDKLRSQVLNDKDAIGTMERILNCDGCNEKRLYILAINILTQLPMAAKNKVVDEASSMSVESRRKFTKLLLLIYTDEEKDAFMRQMAGEALAMLSERSKSDATIILKASDSTLKDLTAMLLDVNSNRGYRICAAEILEHLYIRYTKQDGYLNNLTEAMKDVLPKVLGEIFLVSWTHKEKQPGMTEQGTEGVNFSAQKADIESQDPVACQHEKVKEENEKVKEENEKVKEQDEKVKEQTVDMKLYAALLSLSEAIFQRLVNDDKDLAELTDKIAPGGGTAFSFAGKLKEMVEGNSEQATANCLRMLKITTRMIISLINLNGAKVGADLESLMHSLLKASEKMLELEGFMIFSSSDRTESTNPANILASLVKEAQELLEKKRQAQTTPAPSMETS